MFIFVPSKSTWGERCPGRNLCGWLNWTWMVSESNKKSGLCKDFRARLLYQREQFVKVFLLVNGFPSDGTAKVMMQRTGMNPVSTSSLIKDLLPANVLKNSTLVDTPTTWYSSGALRNMRRASVLSLPWTTTFVLNVIGLLIPHSQASSKFFSLVYVSSLQAIILCFLLEKTNQ